jgi:hypothetical protein
VRRGTRGLPWARARWGHARHTHPTNAHPGSTTGVSSARTCQPPQPRSTAPPQPHRPQQRLPVGPKRHPHGRHLAPLCARRQRAGARPEAPQGSLGTRGHCGPPRGAPVLARGQARACVPAGRRSLLGCRRAGQPLDGVRISKQPSPSPRTPLKATTPSSAAPALPLSDPRPQLVFSGPAPSYDLSQFEPIECTAGTLVLLHGANVHYSAGAGTRGQEGAPVSAAWGHGSCFRTG